MDYSQFIIIGIVLAILYFWYVSIISKKNQALEALASVDVQLKQRLDLIPNILKVAKRFMTHEQTLLHDITALRTKVEQNYNKNDQQAVREHLATVEQLAAKMGQFMVTVENYPTLKSDQTMLQAMQTYNEVEAQIAAARRFYNTAVATLNNAVQIFPGNLLARLVGVAAMPFFAAEDAARTPVDAGQVLR